MIPSQPLRVARRSRRQPIVEEMARRARRSTWCAGQRARCVRAACTVRQAACTMRRAACTMRRAARTVRQGDVRVAPGGARGASGRRARCAGWRARCAGWRACRVGAAARMRQAACFASFDSRGDVVTRFWEGGGRVPVSQCLMRAETAVHAKRLRVRDRSRLTYRSYPTSKSGGFATRTP